MKQILCVSFLLITLNVKAQLSDNFSDGNFSQNPTWKGTEFLFKINADNQLQINATQAAKAHLATPISIAENTEWNFYIKHGFSSSKSNFSRIYLIADNPQLNEPLNGFYLKFGEIGTKDAIELYKQTGTNSMLLCRGKDAFIAKAFALNVKVILKAGGVWEIYAMRADEANYTLQNKAVDTNLVNKGYFGVYAQFTKTNASKFIYDDFEIKKIFTDTLLPKVNKVETISANALKITFNKNIDEASIIPQNFHVEGLNVSKIYKAGNTTNTFELTFDRNFVYNNPYTIEIQNVKDEAGNVMRPEKIHFLYRAAKTHDVLISEIMADPTPVVGLPESEYVELYNRSNVEVDMRNWKRKIGNVQKTIPNIKMPAKSYALITNISDTAKFSAYGKTLGLSGFSLNNTGNSLVLSDVEGRMIHALTYSDNWYKDTAKKDGGWSLEMLDTENPCAGDENWKASIDVLGGTPGKQNSVYASNSDEKEPQIASISIINPLHIKINFTETLDSLNLNNVNNYLIDNEIGTPITAKADYPQYNAVELILAKTLLQGKLYTLAIQNALQDCVGNIISANVSAQFAMPQPVTAGDVLISEILFNPNTACVDFVEIYNNSDKILDLSELILANADTLTKKISKYVKISEQPLLMFPKTYLALSIDSATLKKCHKTDNPKAFLNLKSFISMNNDKGFVAVATTGGEFIDQMTYNQNMHYPLLVNTKGVSLERLNFDKPASHLNNWHSAGSSVGYATPGYKNSQAMTQNTINSEIEIYPSIFSPDNDGYNDFLTIQYAFEKSGTMISIKIYDEWGMLIKSLVNNQMCGLKGVFLWDGVANEKNKAPIGRYILHIEIFNLDGKKKQYKRTAVLGGFAN